MKPELSCENYHFKQQPRDSSNGPEIRKEAFLAPSYYAVRTILPFTVRLFLLGGYCGVISLGNP